ncbi:MAG: sugar transferase [Candidatus Dojkabacteria bacterium]
MLKIFYRIAKRFFDIIISFLLLLLLSPLLLIMFLLIKLQDNGEVFVNEPIRLGLNGMEFRMYKFRSMISNAHQEILNNPEYSELKRKWEKNSGKLRLSEDSRVTFLGRILRKTDMDELPQLLNVLKGEMSLIGPRPMYKLEIEKHLVKYPKDRKAIEKISTVRPGMTGLWQVSGRNDIPFKDRIKMESEYAEKYNLLLDSKIALLTPYVVLTRKGAYE